MKLTTNYGLKKPEGNDVVNIDDLNYNADILDSAIKENKNSILTNTQLINSLNQEVNGQRLRGINIANTIIDKLEG